MLSPKHYLFLLNYSIEIKILKANSQSTITTLQKTYISIQTHSFIPHIFFKNKKH